MITINAISFEGEKEIKVKSMSELEKLYNTIMNEECFILTWLEKDFVKSEVIFTSNFKGRITTGEIKLTSEEKPSMKGKI